MPNPDQIPYVRQLRDLTDIDDIRKVPVIGDLYGAANTIVDFAESGCNPDWEVYVETLFPALGEAVLVVLSFGLDDVLRGYFRPAGGRGFGGLGRASRRNRRLTRAQRARGALRGGIPEIGEMLGRNLPGAEVVRGRNVGNAQRWLWRVDGLAQRALWYWMIADVTEEFIVNWTSALLESEECNCPDHAGVTRSRPTVIVSSALPWENIPLTIIDTQWGDLVSDPAGVNVPDGMTASISWTAAPQPGTLLSGVPNLRLVHSATDLVVDATTNDKTGSELAGELLTAHATVGPGRWEWQAQATAPGATLTNMEARVWLSGCN